MIRGTGGQLLVKSLEAHGVRDVFGIPGVHNAPLYDPLIDSPIRHILVRHEQAASFAADGYARATGKPGVCFVITGPGLTNAATGVAQAFSDSSPLLIVSPEIPASALSTGWRGLLHQLKDQRRMMDAICGYSRCITRAEEIPAAVAEAFRCFASQRPRPVHLAIPTDVLKSVAEAEIPGPVPPELPALDWERVRAAARLLREARRPLAIVGGGAQHAAREVRALVDALALPVMCTVGGRGVVPSDHPLSLPTTSNWLPELQSHFRTRDVVVCIGTELAEMDVGREPFGIDAQVIHVDLDPDQIGRNVPVTLGIVGDAARVAGALAAAAGEVGGATSTDGQRPPAADPAVRAARQREVAAIAARAHEIAASRPHAEVYAPLLAAVRAALDRDGILVNDMSQFNYRATYLHPVYQPRSFLFPQCLGALGFGLPAAIGAQIGCPGRQVLAVMGDGGFQFTLAELATAVQHRLPMPIVVLNNNGYATVRAFHRRFYQGRSIACDLVNPDFVALARAYGMAAHHVTDARGELPARIVEAFRAPGPTLIEVPVP